MRTYVHSEQCRGLRTYFTSMSRVLNLGISTGGTTGMGASLVWSVALC